MIILLDMTQNWNDDWVSKEDDRLCSCRHVLLCSKCCSAYKCTLPWLRVVQPYIVARRFLYALLAVTVGAFAGAGALIGVSFYWFNPSGVGDCSFNVFVITTTILLALAVSLGSLHPQVHQLMAPCPLNHNTAYFPD